MASNGENGSANPTNSNTTYEKIAMAIINTTESVPSARPVDDVETEPQSVHRVVPTGKRRRTSSTNGNRKDTIGQQVDSSRSDNDTNAVPTQRSTHSVTSTSTFINSRFPVAHYDSDHVVN